MKLLTRLIKNHRYRKASFNARLQMEREAQRLITARLNILDIRLKNEGRLK